MKTNQIPEQKNKQTNKRKTKQKKTWKRLLAEEPQVPFRSCHSWLQAVLPDLQVMQKEML